MTKAPKISRIGISQAVSSEIEDLSKSGFYIDVQKLFEHGARTVLRDALNKVRESGFTKEIVLELLATPSRKISRIASVAESDIDSVIDFIRSSRPSRIDKRTARSLMHRYLEMELNQHLAGEVRDMLAKSNVK